MQVGRSNDASQSLRWRLFGWVIRCWARTWQVRWRGAATLEQLLDNGPIVLGFWHEHLAILAPLHADRGFVGMVSRSRDGERLTRLLGVLGFQTIRGSTSTGARAVARSGLRAIHDGCSLAIALDGPRGPRRTAAAGAPKLAEWARRPLVLVGCHAWPAVRLRSWDRQCLPLPFARVTVAYASGDVLEPAAVARQLSSLSVSDPNAPEL